MRILDAVIEMLEFLCYSTGRVKWAGPGATALPAYKVVMPRALHKDGVLVSVSCLSFMGLMGESWHVWSAQISNGA